MENRLYFKDAEDKSGCEIFNDLKESIGWLEKVRVGQWQTFGLFLNENFYVTAGCLDEIRIKMKELNATANKKNVVDTKTEPKEETHGN